MQFAKSAAPLTVLSMGTYAVSGSDFVSNSRVTAVVFGYFKVDKRNNIIDAVDVDNPPVVIHTKGMWLDIPNNALDILTEKGYNIAGSIHAAEHAILSLLPNVVITSPGDVRTECKAPQKEYARVNPSMIFTHFEERNAKKATCKVRYSRMKSHV
jgi:ATP-dependent helicase YprA (DUF1998 family)